VLEGLKALAGLAGFSAFLIGIFGGDKGLAIALGLFAAILGLFVLMALWVTRD
jgi:type IV secretory pathway TrbD component